MRLLGRSPRRAAALAQAPFNPAAPSPDEIAADEAAAVKAEVQAEALLQAEAKAQNKKEKQKNAKKSKQKNAKKSAAGTKATTNVEDVIASPCPPDKDITLIPSKCDEWLDTKTCENAADLKDAGKPISSLIDGQPGTGALVAAVSEPEEEAAPDGGYCTPLDELESGDESEAKHVFQSPIAEVSLVKTRLELSSVKLQAQWSSVELEVRPDMIAVAEVTQDVLYDEADFLEDLDSGFHIIKSGKAKKKMKQLPVEEIIEVVPTVEKKQSPEGAGRTRRRGKKEKVQEAQDTQSPARRKARNPETREEVTPADHVEEQLVIDRDTCDFLCERRKLRLIEIERTSKAQCTLDKAALLLRLSGKSLAVNAARRSVHDLAVQWLEVAEVVWRMLLQTRSSHLNRLQEECECSVDVERAEPWVKISGTTQQVEWAKGWLRQMADKCESVKVRLPSHVKWVEALAKRAEGSGTGVTVALTRERDGFTAHVAGFAAEVKRAVEMLNAEVFKSPPPADARTHWIEVSDSVWRLLLQGCHAGSHLSRLQEECDCSITVDRSSAWIMVNGSENQAEKAQTMLWQFLEECDSPQVRPPSPAKAADPVTRSGEGSSGRARAVFRKEGSSGLNPVEALIRSVNPVEALIRSAEGCSGREEKTPTGARATFKQDHSSGLNPVEAMFKMAEASNGTHNSGAPGTHADAKHMVEALFSPIAESTSFGGSQGAQSRYLSSPDDLVAEYEERIGMPRTPSSSSTPRDLPHISMATPTASPICGAPYSSTSTTSTTPTSPPNYGIPVSPGTVDSDYTNGSDYIGYAGFAGPTPMPFVSASNSQAMPMQGPGGNCFFVPMPVMNPAMMAAPMPMHPVMMGSGTYGYEGVLDGRGVQLPPTPTQQTVFGDTAIVSSHHKSSNASRKIPNKPVLKNAAASTRNIVQQSSQPTPKSRAKQEDDDAKKLASRLAQQFPSARIIVGAPDCQEPPAPARKQEKKKEAPDTMECKMRKLQDLLQKGR